MNVVVVLLALAWQGGDAVVAPPVIAAQEAMHEHDDHGHAHDGVAEAHVHDFEGPRRKQSYLRWCYNALGIRYTLAFLVTTPLVFLGSILVVAMCKRPGPIAAFFPLLALPVLIGVFAFFDGMIMSYSVIASSAVAPKPSEVAAGTSMSLVAPMIAMLLTMPSYLVWSIGLFIRSLTYRPGKDVYEVPR